MTSHTEMDLEFQRVLLRVQESLTGNEVQDLVFLCADLLSVKDLSTVTSAGQLFTLLEKRTLLSGEDASLLLELLRIIKRKSLIRNLTLDDFMPANGTTYIQQISPYRKLLYELSESICEQDLKNIKFLLLKTLSRKKLEKDTTLLQLFLEMEKEDLLDENKLDILQKIIAEINPSLEKRITQYKTERYESGGMIIVQEIGDSTSASYTPASPQALTSPTSLTSVDVEERVHRLSLTDGAAAISKDQSQHMDSHSVTEHVDIQQYEMKGEWRGVCLIINNLNFKSLRSRGGTDIDKESLKVVFEWLGFEVLTKQDCSSHEILQALRDLAARDHKSADCVVCCVLSHGRVEGILGVDEQIVTYRKLVETLTPYQCPSLFKKPKLFFIQACRGTDSQPAAFPPVVSEDEDTLASDAAVPRDTIPEMADYLLAMSTVPYYASFRETEKGTWFIQSLCRNLKLLVPRGSDLLSILTQVNSDVSKKSDKSGLKKQMPQPEFTLTKRLVFPLPKNPPPFP
ncbi:caspase-8 [Garra rufa]|uniref:caspase-8 n=1 Tax=Garra rufa TaxID=137080 RepID=UPI003CCEBEE4